MHLKPAKRVLIFLSVLFGGGPVWSLTYIGQGCTTALWIDKDCDGYVVGGKDGVAGYLFSNLPEPPNYASDADDNDPMVNTPLSAENRYGSFTNINNFKTYLNALGYTHQIANVYFVSLNGNNLTAEPNNINLPYRTIPQPAGLNPPIVQAVDVVVVRAGEYTTDTHT